jgi:hypothetical protein
MPPTCDRKWLELFLDTQELFPHNMTPANLNSGGGGGEGYRPEKGERAPLSAKGPRGGRGDACLRVRASRMSPSLRIFAFLINRGGGGGTCGSQGI